MSSIKKEKIVYILGAGASKDFGLPLGNEFFVMGKSLIEKMNEAHQSRGVISECFSKLMNQLSKVYPNLSKNVGVWPNIEEILTVSHLHGNMDLFNEALNYLCYVLASAHKIPFLNLLYPEKYRSNDKYSNRYSQLHFFIRNILMAEKKEAVFISFNYDVLLDSILGGWAIEIAPVLQAKIINDYTYGVKVHNIKHKDLSFFDSVESYRASGPLLLKPHGSINLVYCSHCHKIYSAEHDMIYARAKESFYLKCCNGFTVPLIIPPLYGKGKNIDPFLGHYMKTMFDNIRTVVSEADKIVVIGYSFPSYDIEIKALLLEGIRNNRKVRWEIIDKGYSIATSLNNIVNDNVITYHNGFINYIKDLINASSNP